MSTSFPIYPEDLTPAFLSKTINALHPGTQIKSVKVTDAKGFGQGSVSTSARVMLDLEYATMPVELPQKVMVKMSMTDDCVGGQLYGLYANEVNFYNLLCNDVGVKTPIALGGQFDKATNRYVLILEDLSHKNVYFPSQLDEISVEQAMDILDVYAKLHAKYWQSPKFNHDLAWVETHLKGGVKDAIDFVVSVGIKAELEQHKFKREILGRIDTTEQQLSLGLSALQRHQSTLPQTLLHGDAHFGNTYRLPNDKIGLYDWQLCVRGFCLHDIAYLITTSLSIEQRRKHERELLAFYRDRLASHGVLNPPSMDTLWLEYRRAIHWCFNIGWLTCPTTGYGWELLIIAIQRTSAAYEDLETKKVVQQLL